MTYDELKTFVEEKAKVAKFEKNVSNPNSLRVYFRSMITPILQTVNRIDTDFTSDKNASSKVDNYIILDTEVIVNAMNKKRKPQPEC